VGRGLNIRRETIQGSSTPLYPWLPIYLHKIPLLESYLQQIAPLNACFAHSIKLLDL